jgi:hypothetical protein
MLRLTGTRVIVVDDKEDEALPILKALARKGVSTAFFHAPGKRGLPKKTERLLGVRLAILDMDLIPGTPSREVKAATIASYLGGILSPDNGPYGVLAWTYHPEIVDEFERYVYESDNIPNPIFTVLLPKNQCIENGKCELSQLMNLIQDQLAQNITLHLFEAWEEACFSAATSVTNTLGRLEDVNGANLSEWRRNWTRELLKILRDLSKAESEQHFSEETCVNAIYESLNPLHADGMENLTPNLCSLLTDSASSIVASPGVVNQTSKAKINSMLHLSFKDVPDFSVGNVYVFRSKHNPSWVTKISEVLDGNWVQGTTEADRITNANAVASDSIPILLDISAVCDHAQKKTQRARLLSGILVPSRHSKKLNQKAAFIKAVGPFQIEPIAEDDHYYFYFSSRQVRSVEITQVRKRRASFRLRSQLLEELRSWVAQIESRPGIVLLKP